MEPPTIPTDADLHEAAQAFAEIIFVSSTLDPKVKGLFIEDFEMGAKWMRRKMREAYELPLSKQAQRRKKQVAK